MEIAKVTSRGQITLPLAIRKKLEVQEGDKVVFYEENGRIVVENAAKLINTKKNAPHTRPPCIELNTLGRVTKIKSGPLSGLI